MARASLEISSPSPRSVPRDKARKLLKRKEKAAGTVMPLNDLLQAKASILSKYSFRGNVTGLVVVPKPNGFGTVAHPGATA